MVPPFGLCAFGAAVFSLLSKYYADTGVSANTPAGLAGQYYLQSFREHEVNVLAIKNHIHGLVIQFVNCIDIFHK